MTSVQSEKAAKTYAAQPDRSALVMGRQRVRVNRMTALVRQTLAAPEMTAIGLGWGGGWPWH